MSGPTVCVREAWQVGGHFDKLSTSVDSAWEQKKFEARKMLENGDESHQPALSLSKGPVHAVLGGCLQRY